MIAAARILTPTCTRTGKLIHDTEVAAQRHIQGLARINHDGGRFMAVYQCSHCQGWHIGHRKKVK